MSEPPENDAGREQIASTLRAPSWTWMIGLLAVLALIVVSMTLLKGGGGDAARGLEPGTQMPPFAAPLADSEIDGDVNLARRPDSGGAGAVPACSVTGAGVVTSCELVADKPAAIVFVTDRRRCTQQIGVVDRVLPPGSPVAALAVAVRGDRDSWRELAQGFKTPLAYDRDGALAASYGIELCPQITVVRRGGRVAGTIIGSVGEAELRRQLRTLLGAS